MKRVLVTLLLVCGLLFLVSCGGSSSSSSSGSSETDSESSSSSTTESSTDLADGIVGDWQSVEDTNVNETEAQELGASGAFSYSTTTDYIFDEDGKYTCHIESKAIEGTPPDLAEPIETVGTYKVSGDTITLTPETINGKNREEAQEINESVGESDLGTPGFDPTDMTAVLDGEVLILSVDGYDTEFSRVSE